jgi:NAD-dependent dihydropyrimidine dehydrogenase PreA subunit
MPYVTTAACIDVTDKSCIEECPVGCIYEGGRKLYINPGECIDCGACQPACPVEAISQDRRVRAGQEEFVADNARFFLEPLPGRDKPLGNVGGSAVFGPVGTDTELVAKWDKADAERL